LQGSFVNIALFGKFFLGQTSGFSEVGDVFS
jgi:hypothetical protein